MKRLLLICLLLTGCASNTIKPDDRPSETQSIFIIGVSPERYQITLFPGSMENGYFKRSNGLTATGAGGSPRNGYIVGKAATGELMGLTHVHRMYEGSTTFGKPFTMCSQTLAFRMPANKVIYVGDLEFGEGWNASLTMRNKSDLWAAQRHLDEHYPQLKAKVEFQPAEQVRIICQT
jgi:hypothetical protein